MIERLVAEISSTRRRTCRPATTLPPAPPATAARSPREKSGGCGWRTPSDPRHRAPRSAARRRFPRRRPRQGADGRRCPRSRPGEYRNTPPTRELSSGGMRERLPAIFSTRGIRKPVKPARRRQASEIDRLLERLGATRRRAVARSRSASPRNSRRTWSVTILLVCQTSSPTIAAAASTNAAMVIAASRKAVVPNIPDERANRRHRGPCSRLRARYAAEACRSPCRSWT